MAYHALYQTFRPARFADIIGQNAIVTALKNQITGGRTAHAYLFCGSRGTGKTTTARVFARAVNCLNSTDGEPCGECEVCREFLEGRSMDFVEIDAASNTGVDDVRDLIAKIEYPPTTKAKKKVYIIDEVHMLSTGAFNALLKTLEEPPEHAMFLLATTEPHKLLPTVLSRCQRYDFRRYTVAVITEQLKKILSQIGKEAEDEALIEIARAAEGGMRDALSLLDMCLSYGVQPLDTAAVREAIGTGSRSFLFDFAASLLSGDAAKALRLIDQAISEGRDAGTFCKETVTHFRNLLAVQALSRASADDIAEFLDCTDEEARQYAQQAENVPQEQLMRIMELFMRQGQEVRNSTQPRSILELCAFLSCRPSEQLRLDALAERVGKLEAMLKNGIPVAAAPKAAPAGDLPPFDLPEPPPADADMPVPDAGPAPAAKKPVKEAAPKAHIEGEEEWKKAKEAVLADAPSLGMPLTKAQFAGMEGDVAAIEFSKNDNMVRRMLDREEKKKLLADKLSAVFGRPVQVIIREQTVKKLSADPAELTKTIRDAREIFGRENVDFLD